MPLDAILLLDERIHGRRHIPRSTVNEQLPSLELPALAPVALSVASAVDVVEIGEVVIVPRVERGSVRIIDGLILMRRLVLPLLRRFELFQDLVEHVGVRVSSFAGGAIRHLLLFIYLPFVMGDWP